MGSDFTKRFRGRHTNLVMILPSGFGLGIPHQNAETDPGYYQRTLDLLKPKVWLNWKYNFQHPDCFPQLWKASWVFKEYQNVLNAGFGDKIWFLSNEAHDPYQANETPEECVKAVRFWKENVGLPCCFPNIKWCTEGINWYREYKRLGGPEPDAYGVHVYVYSVADMSRILRTLKNFDLFREGTPIIVSECAGFLVYPETQNDMMKAIWTAILFGDIQAAFWFSSMYGKWHKAFLASDCTGIYGAINKVGKSFKYWATKEEESTYIPFVVG